MSTPAATLASVGREERESLRAVLARRAPLFSIALILLLVMIGFGISDDRFLSSQNLLNVMRQSAPSLIVAVAATLVLSAGGIDLSVGSLVSFAGVLVALFLEHGMPATLAFILVLLIGLGVGTINGYLIAFQRLPAFIVTLAALSLVVGAAQAFAKGFTVAIDDGNWLVSLAQGKTAGIPTIAVFAVLVAIAGWVVLERTPYGRRLLGIGSNEEAVRRAGVRTDRVLLSVYALSGFASALAGIIVAARLQSGGATNGSGLELQVIAAVVLGGTSLFGGEGSVLGTVLGVLTIAFINNGLVLEDVEPFYVTMITGAILLIAIWANTRLFARWFRAVDTREAEAGEPARVPAGTTDEPA